MKWLKKLLRQNLVTVNIIIMLLGIVCIFVSVYLSTENRQSIVMGLGTSFLSSGVIVFITSLFIDDSNERTQNLNEWGIEAVYKTRSEMNVSCGNYMSRAKKLDIIAFGLKSWRDSKKKTIEALLRKGCEIRILTMDPESMNLRQRELDEKQEVYLSRYYM